MGKVKPSYVTNGLMNVPDIRIDHKGFVIVPKRDFGNQPYWSRGTQIKKGYVVTNGGMTNVMPGATWFHSVIEARHAIEVWIASGGNAQMFWAMIREAQGLTQYEDV